MTPPLQFGRFLPNHQFRTSEGDYFLSSSPEGTALSQAKKNPFADARERDGQFAAIRATISEDVMLGCELVEAVPPIASSIFGRLVDANKGIRGRVLDIAREVRDELVGEPEPVAAKEAPLEIRASGPLPLCVLDIGHHPKAPGAGGTLNGKKVNEFAFNKELADMIQEKVKNARISIIHRETGDNAGLKGLPALTNALNPNFAISLHANSSDPMSHGSEVLYYHTSVSGKKLATILQAQFLAHLGLRDRKIKPKTGSDRGGGQLALTKAVIVIGEPFFIGNDDEFAAVAAKKDELAAAYAEAIDEYATTFSNPAPSAVTEKIVTSTIAPKEDDFVFVTKDLTKEQFLKQNDKELTRLIAAVNARLTQKYGAATCPLTREDAWVITYCEAGLRKDGKVDPDHRHSLGERGLLPLPKHIRDWNGPDAPAWDKPMPIARNLEHFFLYLGHLKNKDLTGGTRRLYMGLFRLDKIKDNTVRQAKVLAGVVHGYFYSGNYRATPPAKPTIPYDHLVSGYQRDVALAKLMKDTTYVHAGKPLMEGRQQNIETALGLL